ncbi:hypothetical protein RZY48_002459 [Vibrio navarrensis]|uniref:Uncharacterized protein n=1 Tax=Vibrio navarrensis TaxID=29495 RepID=A0AAI9CVA1_9VIBR|nr:hypothetical protein [Vibrio navarrensis]
MSVVDEVKKIDINTATAITLFFFSVLAPGLLMVFLYKRDLFINLETLKLVLFSLALGAPGVVLPQFISTICAVVYSSKLNVPRAILGDPKEWFFRHSVSNAINMYLLIFIGYEFDLNFHMFAWIYLGSILLLSIYEMFYLFKRGIHPGKYPPIKVE